jgi:hypothetical protein
MTDSTLLYKEMAGIAEFLPEPPSPGDFQNALVRAFEDHFGVDFRLRGRDYDLGVLTNGYPSAINRSL